MWKKIIFLNLIIMLYSISSGFCSPQGITGTIRDAETKIALANTNIVIKNSNLGTTSDKNGVFQLSFSSSGKFVIQVSMIGYKSAEKTVTVMKDSIISIQVELEPTVILLSPVTVMGKRNRNVIAIPSLESPALEISTSFIAQREIKRQGAKTLIEAMKYVPGALIETRGRKVKQFFSIRGQRYPYPDYAVNGAWQREFLETPYFLSANDIERI